MQLPELDRAVEFYQKVMGLKLVSRKGDNAEFEAGQFRFFLDKGAVMGPIFEFLVLNLEAAKKRLLKAGCKVVRWKGKGGCCYIQDPFWFRVQFV